MCLVTKIRTNYSNLSDKSVAKIRFFCDICKYFPHFFDVSAKKNDFCNIFLQNTVEQICKIICKYQIFFVSLHRLGKVNVFRTQVNLFQV